MEREDRMNSFAKEQKDAQAMKTLKEAILQLSKSQNPSCSQSQREKLQKLIDVCLPSLVSSPLHIPRHPPYAEMIIMALRNLKRKKGSMKTSISSYIKSKYQDLPLAHERLLDHHLQNLVKVGEIVSVTKSLYALPLHNDSNSVNQQQKGQQQPIVVGGQKVEEKMDNNINSGEVVAVPENYPTPVVEVTEPVDLDNVGSGLMSLSERHPTTLLNMETVSGERSLEQQPMCHGRPPKKKFKGKQKRPQVTTKDGDGGLITLHDRQLTTVTEAMKPMRRQLSGHGCGSPDKKSEEVQLQEKVGDIVLAIPATISDAASDDSAVHNHSLKQQLWHRGRSHTRNIKGKRKQLGTQVDDGGLITLLEKNPRSAIEVVKPLQKMLLKCGSEASPSKESEAAEQEEKAGNVAIVAVDGAVGCDHSLKLQPQCSGSRPKGNIEDKQNRQIIMQDRDRRLVTLLEMHPPAVIEVVKPLQKMLLGCGLEVLHHKKNDAAQQQEEVGNIAAAVADDLAAPTHPLEQQQQPKSYRRPPREKYNVKQKQTQITTQDDDGGSVSLLESQLPIVIEAVKPMNRKLPRCGRGRPPNRRNEAEQLQEKVGNTVETIPLAITDASVPADAPAVCCRSPEQKPRRGGRPLKRKFQENEKQVEMQHDEAMEPIKRKMPGRGRGRPPNRKNEAEKLQENLGNIVRTIPVAVTDASVPADAPVVCYHSLEQQPRRRGRPLKRKFQENHEQVVMQHDEEGTTLHERHPISVIEDVKPLQNMLPQHGREVSPNKKTEDAQQQEEVGNAAAVAVVVGGAADDSAYCNHPLEQLPRTRGRPPKRGRGKKKQEELAETDGGLLTLPERPATTVFKAVEPLQKMLPGCRYPPSLDKNSEAAQQQEKVGNIAAAAVAVAVAVAEHQQQRRRGRPKKKLEGEIQPQVTAQDDDGASIPLLARQQAIVIEVVKPTKRKLPGRGRGRPPNEKNEAEQLGEMGNNIERTAVSDVAAANDDLSVR